MSASFGLAGSIAYGVSQLQMAPAGSVVTRPPLNVRAVRVMIARWTLRFAV
mgnify:CR=1 FL=1